MTTTDFQLTPGLQVDTYTLEEQIGSGASGEVWRATNDTQTVALKFLNQRLLNMRDAQRHREQFMSEIQALEHLHTLEHVPKLYGYNITYPRPYLAMTYVDSPSWGALIHSGEIMQVTLRQRMTLLETIATTIEQMHQAGMLHRDIKPSNIHGLQKPYIIDFSIAIPASTAINADPNVGTGIYMPPDVNKPDEKQDIFALAIVVYEMLFGFHPIFSPEYRPGANASIREEMARRLAQPEWSQPSQLSQTKLPSSLRGAHLTRLDQVFKRAWGPWEQRYDNASELITDIHIAVFTEENAENLDYIPETITPLANINEKQNYTLHEVRKIQQKTQHPAPNYTRRRPRKMRQSFILTVGLALMGFIALLILIFSLQSS